MAKSKRNANSAPSQAAIQEAEGLFVTGDALKEMVQIAVQHVLESQVESHLSA